VSETEDRKELFVKTLLPLVLYVNEQIRADRQKMLRLWHQAHGCVSHLSPSQLSWLQSVASRYGTTLDQWSELLRRVDEVPPSLALAQGIVESGWGTASLAWEKNSPFGYRTVTEDGSRLKLHHFKTLPAAVAAYIHNINTHRAYRTLRSKREALRHKTGRVSGHALAEGLQRYSELGQTYIDRLRQVIRQNGLEVFDHARLSFTSI
jgi:Bax protein